PAFGGPSGVLVSKSTDHGNSWGAATILKADTSPNALNDKEAITADPNTSNNVYAVWDRLVSPTVQASPTGFENALGFRGPAWFSRTTNAGASWEPARIIFDPGQENQTIGNQIVAQPASAGGLLVDGFNLISNFKNTQNARGFNVAVLTSADQGATWSGPVIVDKMNSAPVTIPATGAAVRTGDIIPEFAVDRSSGTVYAVWQDARFTGHSDVAFTMSKDGGRSWSPTIRIDQAGAVDQAFTPMVHVANDGTIGVSYYEMIDAAGHTNTMLVHCHPGSADCASASGWTSSAATFVAGPYDMTTAPRAGGFFTGDYEALTDFGSHGFRPFFIQAQPLAQHGKTDPFTAAVCPTTGC
ncbi:MAG TPA: sialidase family protein, partial [Candidatus Eisenbacteria bacterium]|nr:sialidase family protein [Candidatus Eisenbacteria bacterium]